MQINDVFYVASLIEYTGRKLKRSISDIARVIGNQGIENMLFLADINHCLPFEQVSDELIERYNLQAGNFDTESKCLYRVPSHTDIGKVYARLVEDISDGAENYGSALHKVLTSKLPDAISNYNSSLYFASRAEIEYYYNTEFAKT